MKVEPILDRIRDSGPKGQKEWSCDRSRGVTAQTERRNNGVSKIRAPCAR